MRKLFKNDSGATGLEFALVTLPVFLFIFGILQTAWVVWANNLLHIAVDTAARCGAINSTTLPCQGNSNSNMVAAANAVFAPLSGASFTPNSSCATGGGLGLVGSYTVIVIVVEISLTANSCYPQVS